MSDKFRTYILPLLMATLPLISYYLVSVPTVDIYISQLFYQPEQDSFPLRYNIFIQILFHSIPYLTKLTAFICVLRIIYLSAEGSYAYLIKSGATIILISALLGPGLIVNVILKENFGRARPAQTKFFGGNKEFTPAWHISKQCRHNCSFSSGHAAQAFHFSILGYFVRRRRSTYLAGIAFGALVGFARIAQGGHFLSDVFFSALIVLSINHLCYIISRRIYKNALMQIRRANHG